MPQWAVDCRRAGNNLRALSRFPTAGCQHFAGFAFSDADFLVARSIERARGTFCAIQPTISSHSDSSRAAFGSGADAHKLARCRRHHCGRMARYVSIIDQAPPSNRLLAVVDQSELLIMAATEHESADKPCDTAHRVAVTARQFAKMLADTIAENPEVRERPDSSQRQIPYRCRDRSWVWGCAIGFSRLFRWFYPASEFGVRPLFNSRPVCI